MVLLIENICNLKGWRMDTLFMAVSITDNYIAKIIEEGHETPCLITIAVTSTLIAAKLEQTVTPHFAYMTKLIMDQH